MNIQELRDIEVHIVKKIYDDEVCHIMEDEVLKKFVQNCHLYSHEEIKEAQEIFSRIDKLDFSRWYA